MTLVVEESVSSWSKLIAQSIKTDQKHVRNTNVHGHKVYFQKMKDPINMALWSPLNGMVPNNTLR